MDLLLATPLDTAAAFLEAGQVLQYTDAPFVLPNSEDLEYLRSREMPGRNSGNVIYNPADRTIEGWSGPHFEAERVARICADFSENICDWLCELLPEYHGGMSAGYVGIRLQEEATHCANLAARTDLLHLDYSPMRPTSGQRVLRLYVNINPIEPRIWVTSEGFSTLLERYERCSSIPQRTQDDWCSPDRSLARLWGREPVRSHYDQFMRRLSRFLKEDDAFQEFAPRRLWHFQPGEAWLLFTDGLSHAVLRGQYALEHTFYISPEVLEDFSSSPLGQLLAFRASESSLRRAG